MRKIKICYTGQGEDGDKAKMGTRMTRIERIIEDCLKGEDGTRRRWDKAKMGQGEDGTRRRWEQGEDGDKAKMGTRMTRIERIIEDCLSLSL